MFATVTSWIVGFIVGGVFAVLSYLFYMRGSALIAGSLGYSIGVGLLLAIGMQMNFIVWLVGIVVAVVLVVVTFRFNLAKWVIIIATGILGAELIIGSIVLMFYPHADVLANPVKAVMQSAASAPGGDPGHRRGRPGHPGAGQAEPQLHDRVLRPLERAGLILT